MTVAREDLAGVVLAAGAGTRLRPLTDERPKAMCPVGGVPLVDRALASIEPHVSSVAVNAHVSQPMLVEHARADLAAHVSVEDPLRLGTAGAIGHLRGWVDGRHVLVHNADAFVEDDLARLLDGWTGERPRLLVRRDEVRRDFGDLHFVGVSLLPAAVAARLPDQRCGFYDLVWLPAHRDDSLELVEAVGTTIDCGTPADYLRANLHVSGGVSVVDPTAVVLGSLTRCVVWPGARVEAGEDLVDCVRTPLVTVTVSGDAVPVAQR